MSQNSEDSDEQDDDINIDDQSSKDIIIQSQSIFTTTHNKLSIIDQIESINDNSNARDTNIQISGNTSPEADSAHDAESKKTPSEDPENSSASSEISLGSASIESEDKSKGAGKSSGDQDGSGSKESGDISDHERFTESEDREEIIISGDFSGHISAAGDHNADNEGNNTADNGKDAGSISRAGTVDTVSVIEVVERSSRPGSSGNEESSDEKLDGEDTIDFSDEAKSRVYGHGLRIIITVVVIGVDGLLLGILGLLVVILVLVLVVVLTVVWSLRIHEILLV